VKSDKFPSAAFACVALQLHLGDGVVWDVHTRNYTRLLWRFGPWCHRKSPAKRRRFSGLATNHVLVRLGRALDASVCLSHHDLR
jgi:hypothetical protein